MFGFDFSPLFQWGFSIRRPKNLVPILNSNIVIFGNEAVSGSQPTSTRVFANGPVNLSTLPKSSILIQKNNNEEFTFEEVKPGKKTQKIKKKLRADILDIEVICNNSQNGKSYPEEKSPNNPTQNKKTKNNLAEKKKVNNNNNNENESEKIKINVSNVTPLVELSDEEIVEKVVKKELPIYLLEKKLNDLERAVRIRRLYLEKITNKHLSKLPYKNYNYQSVYGQCCENVIGYVPIPVGIAGPIKINDKFTHIPMATTEGCLIASTTRGCKVINESGGCVTLITDNGMTRGPIIRMPNITEAAKLKYFLDSEEGFAKMKESFESTSNYAKLKSIKTVLAGRNAYVRFKSFTGDAMGMNMVSKGVEKALYELKSINQGVEVISLSGNYCTDKKPAAINWIEGRGRYVVAEATIKSSIVENRLKTTVDKLVDLNKNKNLVGSAMAGSIGGFNAHAANIVTAIFIATGQDVAQTIESSNCITLMEKTEEGDLLVSVTMPSIEVATVGGGTRLEAQSACLDIMNARGPNTENPGENASIVAQTVASGVLAGELSLLAALSSGDLVSSHMKLNRVKK